MGSSSSSSRSRSAPAGSPDQPVPVLAARARVADVPVYLDGVGTAKARNTVTVRPQVDGQILKINFKEGQEVKSGDVLAKIDPRHLPGAARPGGRQEGAGRGAARQRPADLERYTRLAATNAVTKQQPIRSARSSRSSRRSSSPTRPRSTTRRHLDYTTIVAPIDGRTGIRMVDEGNIVRASDATGIVVITQVQPITVLFTLPQQQLAAVNKALRQGRAAGRGARRRRQDGRSTAARCRSSTTRSTRRPARCA